MKCRKTLLSNLSFFLVLLSFISAHQMSAQETFRDEFSSRVYNNNDGTQNFSGNWIETNDDNGPTTGRIEIFGNELEFRNLDNASITRNLNLSNFSSVTLTLDYRRTSGNETLLVQLFNGSSYNTVASLAGDGSVNYTLQQSEMSSVSSIRFITGSGNWSNTEVIVVDNVTFSGVIDEPPVVLVTGDQTFCPGTSQPIVETISLTDSDDTTTESVFIQISSGYINGEDVLTLAGTHPSITAIWDPVEGELTLQGPATFAEFEAAILDVEYSSSATSPTGTRQFSITPGTANYLPLTDHYYEFIAAPGITWTDARDAAAARTYFGLQGYLATLTTQVEADFSGSQSQGVGWIGANDATTEGDWQWVTGPEAGTSFWSGGVGGTTVAPFNFAFWNANEPNDFPNGPSVPGQENYAHITDPSVTTSPGSWNDLPNAGGGGAYAPQGYIVEYGGSPGDPVLNLSGVTTITVDNQAPVWDTATGSLDLTFQCASDVPSLSTCTDITPTFFNEAQFSWGFSVQNTTNVTVEAWEVQITNADYQLDESQLTNPSAFNYIEVDNGNGTYNHIFRGTSPIAPFGDIGGNIVWPSVDFGFDPSSDGISVFCGAQPFTSPTATDNCGTVTINQISDITTPSGNSNDFTRVISYQATDSSGNTSVVFTSTITVLDTTQPTASSPAPATVFCSSDVPAPDINDITDEADNCTSNPTVTFISDISDGGTNPEVITRTYRITDESGNTRDVAQTITITPILINTQPSDLTVFAGNNGVFSIGTSNADTFQWQVSTDGGATFNNITDGSDYSGTQTQTLTVITPNIDKNGYGFRAIATHSSSVCPGTPSDNVILTVRVSSVITNRRITYRVNRN